MHTYKKSCMRMYIRTYVPVCPLLRPLYLSISTAAAPCLWRCLQAVTNLVSQETHTSKGNSMVRSTLMAARRAGPVSGISRGAILDAQGMDSVRADDEVPPEATLPCAIWIWKSARQMSR